MSKIQYDIPYWKYCVPEHICYDGPVSAFKWFDTSFTFSVYGSPSDKYYFLALLARSYYYCSYDNKVLYPEAARETISTKLKCASMQRQHRYKMAIDLRRDIEPLRGDPYFYIYLGRDTCDTLHTVYESYVSDTAWHKFSFSFEAIDYWDHLSIRCRHMYKDTTTYQGRDYVWMFLDNLSPVVPDTAYNSAHFPIEVTCEGMGVYRLASPYTGQEQYWYRDTVLLGSGDMLRVSPQAPTTYTLVLGKDSCIPSVLQTRIVPDCGALLIDFPNAFSPNRDGHNDVFRVIPTANLWRLATYELSVYNRWGQRVFHSHDYTQGWDGKDAALGVYYWLCSYTLPDGTKGQRKGDVTLLP